MRRRAGRVNIGILIGGFAITAILGVILYGGFGKDPRAVPSMLVNRPAPDFSLETTDGETIRLSELRGKPVILNFWSTWCQPCKLEHPLLLAAPAQYPDVVFLGAVYADEPAAARMFLKRGGQTYPQLLDPGGRVAIDYGVAGVPETYFINAGGTIIHKQIGPLDEDSLAWLIQQLRIPS